jgi:hypothetical protein
MLNIETLLGLMMLSIFLAFIVIIRDLAPIIYFGMRFPVIFPVWTYLIIFGLGLSDFSFFLWTLLVCAAGYGATLDSLRRIEECINE